MATPRAIKRVPITLDKERTMLLDWNAMYVIEESISARRGGIWISMQDLGDVTKLSIADMRTVIWGALVHEDSNLTERDVGAMVHMGNTAYVCEKLSEAFGSDDEGTPAEASKESNPIKNGSDPLGETAG